MAMSLATADLSSGTGKYRCPLLLPQELVTSKQTACRKLICGIYNRGSEAVLRVMAGAKVCPPGPPPTCEELIVCLRGRRVSQLPALKCSTCFGGIAGAPVCLSM